MDPAGLLAEGTQRYERWRATRSPADLDSAIATFTRLDAAAPVGHALRFFADLLQALALGDRYALSDSVDDIDGVIVRLRRILADPSPPPGMSRDDLDAYHVSLGRALSNRINMYGQPGGPPPSGDAEFLDELQTAIDELALAAVTSSELVTASERAEAAALRAHLIPKLALTRSIIARKARAQADLAELERVLRQTPADHPSRPQLILEAGFAHLYPVLWSLGRAASPEHAEHRTLAERYLSQAVDLLDRGYPERAKAIAYLRYLSITRWPRSPDAAEHADQLLARELADPGPDQAINAVLHLLAGMAASPESSAADLAAAAAHFSQALGLAREAGPAGHPAGFLNALSAAIRGAFLGLLSNLHASSPALDDQDAAAAYGRQFLQLLAEHGLLEQVAGEMPGFAGALVMIPAFLMGMAAAERLTAAARRGDLAGVDAALAELERHLAELPPDHAYRWMLLARAGAAWCERGMLSGATSDSIRGLEALITAMDQAAACAPVTRLVPDANRTALQRAAAAAARLGRLTRDPRALTVALGRMSALRDAPGMTPGEKAGLSRERGMALLWRHGLAHDPQDLDGAITELAGAARMAGEDTSYELLRDLSVAYWTRGDRARRDQDGALGTGLDALRQRAAVVLLQSGAAHGLRAARAAGSEEVTELVRWCLAEGRPDLAIEALELGRALVLHAATVAIDIPGLLTLAGQDALAARWQAETGRGPAPASAPEALLGPAFATPGDTDAQPPLRVPSLLRRQVLDALRGVPAGAQLLAAPGLAELTEALRLAGADAYAYLIPPHREQGCALLLHADGGTGHIPLPGLSDAAPLDAYDDAYRAATGSGWDDPADRRAWANALEALCDWAWDAAAAPVLRTLAEHPPGPRDQPGRAPRIVLIPVGRLGVVPWHAARTLDQDGRPRYAVQDAVFGYAASAGQFARASRRRSRPWAAAPLLLSDPAGDLEMARVEVTELMSRYYPDAVLLGSPPGLADGPGTPDEVLSRLPGGSAPPASLVHCGCHADVAPSLADSHLWLAGGRPLSIADILAQARHQDPASPGFLGVLSACLTDLAPVDHDEALTLASALLAAGACAVVGARWPAGDRVTAPIMVMFHHFLNNGHPHPADALRAAQLWMLDTARAPLDGLPPRLADAARRGRLLTVPYAWAAFTCHGGYAAGDGDQGPT